MPQCSYCEMTIADEEDYLDHLADEHENELGRIDQRRVDERNQGTRWNRSTLAIGGVAILLVAVVVGVFLLGGGDGSPTPATTGHIHGTMTVSIDGTELPLSQSGEFTNNADFFHFHGNEMQEYGEHLWHIHGSDITLQQALDTLGIEVDETGTELTYDGETYVDGQGNTTIEISVDGEPVEPGTYALRGVGPEDAAAAGDGDNVVVQVTTDN